MLPTFSENNNFAYFSLTLAVLIRLYLKLATRLHWQNLGQQFHKKLLGKISHKISTLICLRKPNQIVGSDAKTERDWQGISGNKMKSISGIVTKFRLQHWTNLTHYRPVLLFYTPWKYQKTVRFFDVFRGYRKATLGCNGLSELINFISLEIFRKALFLWWFQGRYKLIYSLKFI